MATENKKSNYYISSLLRKLQSSSASSVQKSLISLSRATRKSDNVVKLREEGGIALLLNFLQSSNKKALDMAVSVLANCALEKQCRTEIEQLNGLALLCNLLASLADTSIISRVTRALANLSQDVRIAGEIVNLGAIPKLFDILEESTDMPLLQNSLRALRIMSRSYACTNELAEGNRLLIFVEFLQKQNDNEIKRCCLRTLLELAKAANGFLATQIQEHGGIEVVCQLSYSDDAEIKEHCISILRTLTNYSAVRVSVGTIGGIRAFLHHIRERGPLLFSSIKGVCMCCREAVNRNKVRSSGGLEVLLDILRCPEYSRAIDDILGAFSCFSYDDIALKLMIEKGLIPIMISILEKILFPENEEVAEKQDNDMMTTNDTTASKSCSQNIQFSENVLKPTALVTALQNSSTTKAITVPLPSLPGRSHPASPPSCISPNLSPELRIPYMSAHSPQSARSSSPLVYSPLGSEIGNDFSSECDSHSEQETEDVGSAASQELTVGNPDDSTTWNDATMSHEYNDSPRGEAAPGSNDVTATNENMLSNLMEDVETTHAGSIALFYETGKQHWPALENDERSFLHWAHGHKARVHLLPGTNFNEHVHLFLPDENLFSADQPSPKKVQPHGANRYPLRRTSEDLPKTSKRPNVPKQTSWNYGGLQGIECKIIFLLSRFGQLPDAADLDALISPACIQILLDYLCYSSNPDPRCMRLFSRLAWDAKFFEKLVVIMLPGAIYRQLICGLRPGYLRSATKFDNKETKLSKRTSETSPTTTHAILSADEPAEVLSSSFEATSKITKGNATSDANFNSHESVTPHQLTSAKASTADRSQTCRTKERSSDVFENKEIESKSSSPLKNLKTDAAIGTAMSKVESIPRNNTKETGKSLLSVLTTQAGTPFGKGILAHLLLRGTQKQKEACALSLPYLCKPLRMKQKLLIEHKGIVIILSILCDSTKEADIIRALHAITYLVANSTLKMDKSFKVFFAKDESEFLASEQREADLLSTENRKSDKDPEDKDRINVMRMPRKDGKRFEALVDKSEMFSGVSRKADRLRKSEEGGFNSERYRKSHSVQCQSEFNYKTARKRLHHSTDSITCKRTKVESVFTELETCSGGSCSYDKSHSIPFDVVVKVDSGESIEAHRSVLCAFSEVFAAMLSSDFIEASQSEIMIKDITHTTVLFLVHYAYGCSWSVDHRAVGCPVLEESLSTDNLPLSDRFTFDFEFLLELLVCADRFLLADLKKQCEQLLMHGLTGDHVADAYLAAVVYNTARLRVYCLQFIFLGDLELNCVYNCVVKLLHSQVRERVVEDFKNIALDCCSVVVHKSPFLCVTSPVNSTYVDS